MDFSNQKWLAKIARWNRKWILHDRKFRQSNRRPIHPVSSFGNQQIAPAHVSLSTPRNQGLTNEPHIFSSYMVEPPNSNATVSVHPTTPVPPPAAGQRQNHARRHRSPHSPVSLAPLPPHDLRRHQNSTGEPSTSHASKKRPRPGPAVEPLHLAHPQRNRTATCARGRSTSNRGRSGSRTRQRKTQHQQIPSSSGTDNTAATLWYFGPPSYECSACGALMWWEERVKNCSTINKPQFSLCCQRSKIQLPAFKDPPAYLAALFQNIHDQKSKHFLNHIRKYNAIFQFTSMGGKVDTNINRSRGPYVFRISGNNYHKIGSLLPVENTPPPRFLQLYVIDSADEAQIRRQTLQHDDSGGDVDPDIVRGLITMLDQNNVVAKVFRTARERFREADLQPVRVRLLGKRKHRDKRYNEPTADEVAIVIVGDFSERNFERDIVVEHRSKSLQRISDLHPSYMAMQYPLLFPYGEDGYHPDIPYSINEGNRQTKRSTVTMREYYSYLLQFRRNQGKTLFHGGKLLQQLVVDAYCAIEAERLRFIRLNQKKLRSDLYKNICDAVTRGDITSDTVGKRTVLPSSFTGGPRYMIENYQNALAICRAHANPDLFITFTANGKWREIEDFISIIPGQQPNERPEVETRVFKIKLDQFIKDITSGEHFGQTTAVVYTIEFQKRGLPHAHILLWLHPSSKLNTPSKVNKYISAEIPNKDSDPVGYELVNQFMMHGPCGDLNKTSKCMKSGKCTKKFPKRYSPETTIDEDGFPSYRRRFNGAYIEKGTSHLDNRFVIPFNRDILVKFQCHVNVELCNKTRAIKYLFKYMHKGPDRAVVVLQENVVANSDTNTEEIIQVNEIEKYLDCRYIAPCDAAWRIFSYPIHHQHPAVLKLIFHLPDEQMVSFRDAATPSNVVTRPDVERSMFTEWMLKNTQCQEARKLTYTEFPQSFVWEEENKKWHKRIRGQSIGRLPYTHPSAGERYYMRMLLNMVRGPQCYADIRTYNNVTYPTFKDACQARGLLTDDKEWHQALEEASYWAPASRLWDLFVTILIFCEVTDPQSLLNSNWKYLADDVLYKQRSIFNDQSLQMSDTQIQNCMLVEIQELLSKYGKSLLDFEGLPLPDLNLHDRLTNRLIQEETNYNRDVLLETHQSIFGALNQQQRQIYDEIVDTVHNSNGGFYFLYGHGGTGKTFVYKAIITRLRAEGQIVLAVASSGIASLLLPGGRTAHSRFSIPIELLPNSTCTVNQGTQLATLIQKADLVIWDEAPMDHRFCFEAVDRTFKDIMKGIDPSYHELPFGGKTVLLGGDFRQILPVVPHGSRQDIVDASINRSSLWDACRVFFLTENMRLSNTHTDITSRQEMKEFADWVLRVGDGEEPGITMEEDGEKNWIKIPRHLLVKSDGTPIESMVRAIFTNFSTNYDSAAYLSERAILAPTNSTVDLINHCVMELLPGECETFLSSDTVSKSSDNIRDQDILYPTEFLNTLMFPGIPNHELQLKVGVPVMLLRNLNPHKGLCNGTRLLLTKTGQFVLEGKIITGSRAGDIALIPRIVLSSSESKWPFILKRRQFPVKVSYAMTINKSQGQTLNQVGLYLKDPVFSHGQLYVALSRVTSQQGLKVIVENDEAEHTKNVVFKETYDNLPKPQLIQGT